MPAAVAETEKHASAMHAATAPAGGAQGKKESRRERNRRTGREIAFGIQQTLTCFATDFIDPIVAKWFQTEHGNKEHEVTHKHVWVSEVAGDTSAFFVYMFMKRFLTKPVDFAIASVKKICDPLLTRLAKKSVKVSHADAEEYARRLDEYKSFQAENIVDTGIIATAATALNVGVQKAMGNKQSVGIILSGKMIGTVVTVLAMLGLRTGLPTTTRSLDHELSDRYFSKVIAWTKKTFGIDQDETAQDGLPSVANSTSRLFSGAPILEATLTGDKRAGMIRMLADHARGQDISSDAGRAAFIAREKNILHAMIHLFSPDDAFVRTMAQKHFDIIARLQGQAIVDKKAEVLENTSLESIQSIAVNRRDDLTALKKLLDDPAFMAEAFSAMRDPNLNQYVWMTPERKTKLVDSLLQARDGGRGEPAVHIFAGAKGQMLEHKALAECFDPKGSVTRQFTEELKKHLKTIRAEEVEAIAGKYMFDRQEAALRTTDAFSLEGEVVREAVERSEAIRRKLQPSSDIHQDTPPAMGR